MDFFESQELARKKTRQLVVLFIFAIIAIIASIYFAFTWGSILCVDRNKLEHIGQARPLDGRL